jgi:hypothetical protein
MFVVLCSKMGKRENGLNGPDWLKGKQGHPDEKGITMKTLRILTPAAVALLLASCASSGGSNDNGGISTSGVAVQSCALGAGAGAGIGALAGHLLGENAALGAVIGGLAGAAAGCTAGQVLEARRGEAANDAAFYDQEIARTEQTADKVFAENNGIRQRIELNQNQITQLQSAQISSSERVQKASAAKAANERALEEYNTLIAATREEIAIQQTLVAELENNPQEAARAAELEQEITRLEQANRQLESNVQALTAQNDTIGGFL